MKILFYFFSIIFLAEISFAKTYYVATTGKDLGNEIGSLTSPFRTIAKGSRKLAAGDTLYIRKGLYEEGMLPLKSTFVFKNGISKSQMTRYAAYPGEELKVILKPKRIPGDPDGGATYVVNIPRTVQYVEIRGLVLDGTNGKLLNSTESTAKASVNFDGSYKENRWARNNRLIENDIVYGGIYGGGGNEIIRNRIHHSLVYGLYTAFPNGIVEGNVFHDNNAAGLHLYQETLDVSGWVIRNNIFTRNGNNYHPPYSPHNGNQVKHAGVILTKGNNCQFYNNIVYGNVNGGVLINSGINNFLFASNTIYGNGYGVKVGPSAGKVNIVNNIVWGNGGSTQIQDFGPSTVLNPKNNLTTTNPQFVNAAAANFRLNVGSPAINKGMPVIQVKNDFVYANRVGLPDIGAYEYGAASATLIAPTNLRVSD